MKEFPDPISDPVHANLESQLMENGEVDGVLPLHVYNETDPLRTVALWGPPGPEAVLAQLLPSEENLFYSNFDVRGARQEYARLLDFLNKKGIQVALVQDLLLYSVDPEQLADREMIPRSVKQLISDMENRGRELYRKYGVGDLSALNLLPELVQEDIDRLGEWPAIVLNWMLSLRHIRPSGNIFYGRDQANVLGDKIIWSQMRWPIRRPEVGMYKMALEPFIGKEKHHRIRGKEAYLEGGDGIMVDGDVYLGVGGRTTLAGAVEVYKGVSDYLLHNDKQFFIIIDEEAERRTHKQKYPGEEQQVMHLDTFWMPFADGKKVLCCMEDVSHRTVGRVYDTDGCIRIESCGSFADFMEEKGMEIFEIPKEEQLRYATNFLNIDKQTVIVPFSDNSTAIAHLEREGINVLPVEMTELGGGYGAIHCMTTALNRR